jgi:hypothetical protein
LEALNMATPMATPEGAELAALALGARLLVGLDAELELQLGEGAEGGAS